MGKSSKLKFNRDCNLRVKYLAVTKPLLGEGFEEKEVGSLEYRKTGEVVMRCEGFEVHVQSVDEVEVCVSPMDSLFTKTSFKIKKTDDSKTTLPHKFYGIRGTNVLINYDSEIGGDSELPDDNM